MTIEKLDGTSPRLYTLVAPLVMRRSVLRRTTTTRSGLRARIPGSWPGRAKPFSVHTRRDHDGGVAKINNYYVSGDDPHLLSRFLREIIQYYRRDYTIRSMTLIRHAEIFRSEGFVPMKEWTQYVTMEYSKNR